MPSMLGWLASMNISVLRIALRHLFEAILVDLDLLIAGNAINFQGDVTISPDDVLAQPKRGQPASSLS